MSDIRFECVMPREDDARLIMMWRNDPDTLRQSFHQTSKVWEDFYSEFIRDYFIHPSLPPLFILLDGNRVGFILFKEIYHPFRKQSDISINIDPQQRGRGIGAQALKKVRAWIECRGVDDIIAEMKVDNEASKKAFERAGFEFVKTGEHFVADTGESVPVHCYRLSITSRNEPEKVFIIAEAGSNWSVDGEEKSLQRAKKMIDSAAEAGVDAVKFQTFRSEALYVKNAGSSGYLSDAGLTEDIHEILKRNEMPYGMIPKLADYCESCGVEFMSSVFSPEDFKAVDPFVKRHKLASYEISHTHLIELMAKSGKPLIMSTGCSNLNEIAWAVDIYRRNGGRNLTLMQCTAKYPASIDCLNLQAIRSLKKRFHSDVGLSDHSQNPVIGPVAAVALGAAAIEKHFTLDRTLQGPDHAFSLEPDELRLMVKMIRKTEQAMGSGVKDVLPEERELYDYARRWLQATKAIAPGDFLLEDGNFAILRPGSMPRGAHPMYIPEIEGKKAIKSIAEGEGVTPQDVE